METGKFYVYIHLTGDRAGSPGQVFYVGKGSRRRAWSRSDRTRYWICKSKKHGYTVQILAHWDAEADAFEHERTVIASYRSIGVRLVNLTDGGEGASGNIVSEATKAKISAGLTGIKRSPSTCAKISAVHKGKTVSEETKAKLRAKRSLRVTSDATRAKMSASQTGRKMSKEAVDKTTAAHRGAKRSAETISRLSAARKGVPWSENAYRARGLRRSNCVHVSI